MLLVDEAMQTGVPGDPVIPGSYGGSASPRVETPALTADLSQYLTLDEAADAEDQVQAAETEPNVVQVQGVDPDEAANSAQAPPLTETMDSDDHTSAADHMDAPLTESGSGGLRSSNDAIPVVDEGSIELDAAGNKEAAADPRRAAQLVQQGSTSEGVEHGSVTASPKGAAGWSGGQMAGLIVGVIAAGCIAAVAVVRLKRRRRPAQANYSAFAHDIEMRGLI